VRALPETIYFLFLNPDCVTQLLDSFQFEVKLKLIMKETWKILVVDDDPVTLRTLTDTLSGKGYAVAPASSEAEALALIEKEDFAVVITAGDNSRINGCQIAEAAKNRSSLTEVIIITEYPTLDGTLTAIRQQAFELLTKPVDLERMFRAVENALNEYRLARDNAQMISQLSRQQEILRARIREVSRDLEQLSTIDALTGLYNYRYFSEVIQTEIRRSLRYQRPMTLAMLDLDHFKHYNDCYGHVKGNEVLREVAAQMRSAVREVDLVIRYGGEEFAILLPETPKEKARTNIARVCQRIRELDLAAETPEGRWPITLSAGLSACPEDGRDSETLITAADLALYRAKSMGRNQIVFYTPALRELEEKRR